MPIYNVTLQDETNEILKKDFIVNWDPDKVDADEVGRACATQERFFSGKCTRGGEPSFKKLYQCISCELIVVEDQLQMPIAE